MQDPGVRRVLLADRQLAFAQALWFVLDRAAGLECVGHVVSVDELDGCVQARRPDVVLVDVGLLGGDGRTLPDHLGTAPSVLLADVLDASVLARASEVGAVGVVARDRDLRTLVACLSGPLDAGFRLESSQLADVLGRRDQHDRRPLTRRELEVLALLTEGCGPREIAERLGIGLNTSRGHVKNLRRKLDARTSLEVVARGREAGLV